MESTLGKVNNMSRGLRSALVICVAATTAVALLTTPYMGAATFAYALICIGYRMRKTNSRGHAGLMATGMLLDVSLVVILEFQRAAIETVALKPMTGLETAHVGFSLAAVLLYIPLAILGLKLLRFGSEPQKHAIHKWLGIAAFIARTAGFILMFSLLNRVAAR